jgi:hypothetical protein
MKMFYWYLTQHCVTAPKNEELNLAMKKDKKSDDNKSKTKSDDLGSGKIYVLRNNKPEMIRVKNKYYEW